jgi:hypothetical protein
MSLITDHKVNGLNEALTITADGPGPGGASHRYDIIGADESNILQAPRLFGVNLRFQNGPISKPSDMNGITNEALLAILIDRMRGFQHGRKLDGSFDFASRGRYACKENACALTHLEEALMWLQKRTRDRMARGVEGTHSA